MQYIGSWQFWLSVILVTFIAHWAMTTLMPKMSGGGGS
jgi:hypothetical protein